MGRLWLALALLVALASTAAANCACRTDVILPRSGATGVPTNARFWHIPASGITTTPDQRIQVYELAPHTAYELNAPHLSFTTGDGRDDTPPVAPRIDKVSVALDHTGVQGVHPVGQLQIDGTFSNDTAIVRIDLTTPSGMTEYFTTPDTLSVCDLGFGLPPGNVDVAITAIDLAGNQSSPVTYNATATVAADDVPTCAPPSRMRGPCVPFFLVEELGWWLLGPLAYITVLVIVSSARTRRRRAITPDPIALPAVEALARAIRRTAILRFAAVGTVITIATRAPALLGYASAAIVMFVFVTAAGWDAATKVLRLASYDGATATVRGDEVSIKVGGKEANVRAAPWRVQRAKAHGVPRATI